MQVLPVQIRPPEARPLEARPLETQPLQAQPLQAQPLQARPLEDRVPLRARMRAVAPLDVVSFVSACPACGADCEWTQLREETRVRTSLACPCAP